MVFHTIVASAIQNLQVLEFSLNQGRMVLTIRYSGSYSVLGSQILLDKWTPCTMRLSHHCAPLAQGLGSADAQQTLIQCMNK